MTPTLTIGTVAHPRFLVVLWLHTAAEPDAEQWDDAVARLVGWRRANGAEGERIRQLIISDGGAPNARQRAKINHEFLAGLPSKAAVLTTVLSHPLKRGIATALSWVNPAIRFYDPGQLGRALEYLDLPDCREPICAEYDKLQAELPKVHALALAKLSPEAQHSPAARLRG